MQTARRGEKAVRKGQEEERGQPNSSECLQGVEGSSLSLPLPRQTLKAIFRQPKVSANLGWIRVLLEIRNHHCLRYEI